MGRMEGREGRRDGEQVMERRRKGSGEDGGREGWMEGEEKEEGGGGGCKVKFITTLHPAVVNMWWTGILVLAKTINSSYCRRIEEQSSSSITRAQKHPPSNKVKIG